METITIAAKWVCILVTIVFVMESAGRVYRKLFPMPVQEIRIVVVHHLTADGIEGTFDITTDVLSVAMGVEAAAKKAID